MEKSNSLHSRTEYDFLIITPLCFKNQLIKLVKHKKKFNIETLLVTLENIYKSKYFHIQGRDRQEKIKYFIKNAYEKWKIKYVLLIGGHKQLPVRYIHNFDTYPGSSGIKEPPYISDLYYADLYDQDGNFSSWDTNDNGIFGEWIGKVADDQDIDLNPDVCIGRLPCKNRTEVKVVIDKIINYEKNTSHKPWFKNIVAVGGNTYPELGNTPEGEKDLSEALTYMKNFNHIELYSSNKKLTRGNIIRAINRGCGFLALSGHGNPPFWTTYVSTSTGFTWLPKFYTYHMHLLTNVNKFPICIASGCRNSAFDTNPINLIKHPTLSYYWMDCIRDCWMWAIVKKPTGGAIASLGSTGIGHIKYEHVTGGKADGWSYLLT
ncbi:MAG TPA: hypothetical protein ENI51_10345, partial [Candidatus Atribacteria bacterium]|nr:hypothetical protein [Candidatus Atribacteria bacterium]